MARPIITLDAGMVRRSVARTKGKIQEGADIAIDESKVAMVRYALFLINESASKIDSKSGDLAAAGLVADIEETEDEIRVPFGFNSPYGAQRDRGGTIFAKPGKSLAIPLPPVLTASGVARFSSPLEEPNLTLIKGKRFVFLAVVPKDRPMTLRDLHWILKRSVTQEGSSYFSKTIADNKEQTAEILAFQVKERLDQ